MTDATQQSDLLALEECLATMRRIGIAHPEYIEGYRSGYLGEPYDFGRGIAYARGRAAGMNALDRGAHGASEAVVIGVIDRGIA